MSLRIEEQELDRLEEALLDTTNGLLNTLDRLGIDHMPGVVRQALKEQRGLQWCLGCTYWRHIPGAGFCEHCQRRTDITWS